MKISCIIVDDEPLAREGLRDYVDQVGYLEVAGEFKSALEAKDFLESQAVDLVFLDINMPKMSGLEFVKALSNPPAIIFTTAYREFATDSYELEAVDYLVKPITFERFFKAVNKVYQRRETPVKSEPDHFYVKVDGHITEVKMDEVLFIEGMKDYIKIYLQDDSRLITLLSLKQVEKELPSSQFIRTHRSFIVSKHHVDSIEGNTIHIQQSQIPIAPNLRSEVLDRILGDKFWKRG